MRIRHLKWQGAALAVAVLFGASLGVADDDRGRLARVQALGLAILDGKVPVHYSAGHRQRAEKVQGLVSGMANFYEARRGIRGSVHMAVLDRTDWLKACSPLYGFPFIDGVPPAICMPATSAGIANDMMAARRSAIPPDLLRVATGLGLTFQEAADTFVDIIALHELGHFMAVRDGISAPNAWLNELVASYYGYAYVVEARPDLKQVFDLLGRPPQARPMNRTLEDFERLYDKVDDYAWYQGMFEARVREIHPGRGLAFLDDLRRVFPWPPGQPQDFSVELANDRTMAPARVLALVEPLAPGFKAWSLGFQ